MTTIYQAWVEVHGTEGYRYWNKLGDPKPTRALAEEEVVSYRTHKEHGTCGYRRGAPARTRIDEREVRA